MENKEENEVLQIIGFVENWQLVEDAATPNIAIDGKRELRPQKKATVILICPRITLAASKYDRTTLKCMLQNKNKLCFKISMATEDDMIVKKAKEKLEKSHE